MGSLESTLSLQPTASTSHHLTEMQAFIRAEIPGKGSGLLAARKISRGELILEESPILTHSCDNLTEAWLKTALRGLTPRESVAFWSLSHAWMDHGISPRKGIWITNAIPCGSPDDPDGEENDLEGIFPVASRFNSSCTPNVFPWWDACSQKLAIRAVREIDIGEELCVSYIDVLIPRRDRAETLRMAYNFDCRCTACSLEGEDLVRSDHNRGAMYYISQRAAAIEGLTFYPCVGLSLVMRGLGLLRAEGLLDVYGNRLYAAGFEICALGGDAASASAWAMRAWEFDCTTKGPNSVPAQEWMRLANNPASYENFGRKSDLMCKLYGPDAA
ncbi:SET domain-containing protein [Trametes sanguinea]|nr:SET domain-containing protein [Trametes sanguinea]